jgi:hypothetical protein
MPQESANSTITITDISGRVITLMNSADQANNTVESINTELRKISIDLSNIGKGIYILKVFTDNNMYSEKITVQ